MKKLILRNLEKIKIIIRLEIGLDLITRNLKIDHNWYMPDFL